jgi:hypothetical protein
MPRKKVKMPSTADDLHFRRCGSPNLSRERPIKLLWMLKLRRYLEDMGLASSLDPNPAKT